MHVQRLHIRVGMYKLQYFQLNHDHKLYTYTYSVYMDFIYLFNLYGTILYAKIFRLINHAREPCSLITSRHHYYHHIILLSENDFQEF